MEPSVEYLGQCIDASGLHTTAMKRKAIKEAPTSINVTQLHWFSSHVSYYGMFIPNLTTTLHPLNWLLEKEAAWLWTKQCQETFESAKAVLGSGQVLAHYEPSLLGHWLLTHLRVRRPVWTNERFSNNFTQAAASTSLINPNNKRYRV